MFNARSKIMKKGDVKNLPDLIEITAKVHRPRRRSCQVPAPTGNEQSKLEGQSRSHFLDARWSGRILPERQYQEQVPFDPHPIQITCILPEGLWGRRRAPREKVQLACTYRCRTQDRFQRRYLFTYWLIYAAKRHRTQKIPRSRNLKAVHEAILEDIVIYYYIVKLGLPRDDPRKAYQSDTRWKETH